MTHTQNKKENFLKEGYYSEGYKFKCGMCNRRSFKTQEELSRHQHLFCTGGW